MEIGADFSYNNPPAREDRQASLFHPAADDAQGGTPMSPTMPEGATVRKAIQWISKMREEKGIHSLSGLIDEACIRFNCSPKDCDFIQRFFREAEGAEGGKK
jgi:hypothetical protein